MPTAPRPGAGAAARRGLRTPSTPLPPMLDLDPMSRILAVRLDNAGDVVMLGPALRALREAAPRAHITLLASPAGADAATLLPWVDDVQVERVLWQDASRRLAFDPDRELGLVERLAAGRYDAAFIFTSFSQTPYPAAYACYLARIRVRVGQTSDFGGAVLSHVVPPLPGGSHQAERNLHLVESIGVPIVDRGLAVRIPAEAADTAKRLLHRHGIRHGQPYVVMAPGATAAARRYPAERFVRVAEQLVEALPGDHRIVVVGADAERTALAGLTETPGVVSLVGETSFAELAAVIAGAHLLVASHSAPMHLADAVGVPSVVLFSGTDRRSEWAPRRVPSTLLGEPTPCAPCRQFDCPYGLECLDVSPDVVTASVLDRLPAAEIPSARTRPLRWLPSAS